MRRGTRAPKSMAPARITGSLTKASRRFNPSGTPTLRYPQRSEVWVGFSKFGKGGIEFEGAPEQPVGRGQISELRGVTGQVVPDQGKVGESFQPLNQDALRRHQAHAAAGGVSEGYNPPGFLRVNLRQAFGNRPGLFPFLPALVEVRPPGQHRKRLLDAFRDGLQLPDCFLEQPEFNVTRGCKQTTLLNRIEHELRESDPAPVRDHRVFR